MAKIIPLSEGTFTIGGDKIFIPFDPINDDIKTRSQGSLVVEIQPFLIIDGDEYILLDTGLGYHLLDGQLQIHANLQEYQVSKNQITKVIMSHLHKDHAGGISFTNKFGKRELSFPNADYYIYKAEFEYAMANPGASYLIEEFEYLVESGKAIFYEEKEGTIGNHFKHFWSGGHCPQHQVILFDDGKDKIFFGGDEAPQLKQMKMKYIAKYDKDGKRAAELREIYAAKGKEEHWKFLFYHDIASPIATL
jgi:glyoxylase-like metal-dependent hydrolase (beta-lactamase superfamily II)